jgi:hypothetical protein
MNTLLAGAGAGIARPVISQPHGRLCPAEWEEMEAEEYLSIHPLQLVGGLSADWWIPYRTGHNKRPTWDLICNIMVAGTPGLLLCEAKAHVAELRDLNAKKPPLDSAGSHANDLSIRLRLCEASKGLSEIAGGRFELSTDHHYQMSNRLAYLWKIASQGVPTVLMYLGFLGCPDWPADPISDAHHWRQLVEDHLAGIGPRRFIDRTFASPTGGSLHVAVCSL